MEFWIGNWSGKSKRKVMCTYGALMRAISPVAGKGVRLIFASKSAGRCWTARENTCGLQERELCALLRENKQDVYGHVTRARDSLRIQYVFLSPQLCPAQFFYRPDLMIMFSAVWITAPPLFHPYFRVTKELSWLSFRPMGF